MLIHKDTKGKKTSVVTTDVTTDSAKNLDKNKRVSRPTTSRNPPTSKKPQKVDTARRVEVKTKHTGLYTLKLGDGDINFIGRWKTHGRSHRVSLGKVSDGMTLESAHAKRLTLIEGFSS